MEKQCGGKVIGGLENEKKYIFEGRGSGGRSLKRVQELHSDSDLPERWQGKQVTHEEIDEALERFLKWRKSTCSLRRGCSQVGEDALGV